MKASGCKSRVRHCHFPRDRYANLTPVRFYPLNTEIDKFVYYIEWDRRYRNAPTTVRDREICEDCSDMLWKYTGDLIHESLAIDRYYERSDRESLERKRHAKHAASG